MDQFVCVRLVQANRLDLRQFQFDYDLTFAVLMMNADGTIYGRYGTRSSVHEAERDISLQGFAEALAGALELHRNYPTNRESLAGKQPRPVQYATPDDFPELRGKYAEKLNYAGQVVQSCMHCHQIRDAERSVFRTAGEAIPNQILFPYPLPEVIGLQMDPKTRATVGAVADGSAAATSGFRPGDNIVSLDDQPMLSTADIQWVLHHAADADTLAATVEREGRPIQLTLQLPDGWRRESDISWRVSTWPLRRMGTGGLVLEPLNPQDRKSHGVRPGALALRVKHVGQYGPHAVAKQAGFAVDDIVVAFDGNTSDWSESQLLAYAVQNTTAGQLIPVVVMRDESQVELTLKMQN